MLQCVIFDMDGTLLDTERVTMPLWIAAGKALGYEIQENFVLSILGTNRPYYEKQLTCTYGSDFPLQQFRQRIADLTENYYATHPVPVKAGAKELLQKLKARCIKTALATSSDEKETERNLAGAGLQDAFDVVVTGDMIARSKPHPDIFCKAMQLAGSTPETSVVLEDSHNGFLAGIAAGCRTFLVPDLISPPPADTARATGVLERLSDLIPLLPLL